MVLGGEVQCSHGETRMERRLDARISLTRIPSDSLLRSLASTVRACSCGIPHGQRLDVSHTFPPAENRNMAPHIILGFRLRAAAAILLPQGISKLVCHLVPWQLEGPAKDHQNSHSDRPSNHSIGQPGGPSIVYVAASHSSESPSKTTYKTSPCS